MGPEDIISIRVEHISGRSWEFTEWRGNTMQRVSGIVAADMRLKWDSVRLFRKAPYKGALREVVKTQNIGKVFSADEAVVGLIVATSLEGGGKRARVDVLKRDDKLRVLQGRATDMLGAKGDAELTAVATRIAGEGVGYFQMRIAGMAEDELDEFQELLQSFGKGIKASTFPQTTVEFFNKQLVSKREASEKIQAGLDAVRAAWEHLCAKCLLQANGNYSLEPIAAAVKSRYEALAGQRKEQQAKATEQDKMRKWLLSKRGEVDAEVLAKMMTDLNMV